MTMQLHRFWMAVARSAHAAERFEELPSSKVRRVKAMTLEQYPSNAHKRQRADQA